MKIKNALIALALMVIALGIGFLVHKESVSLNDKKIEEMVRLHAKAWETADESLLSSLLDDQVVFAYPGRRLTKQDALADVRFFKDAFTDTKVYINKIIVDGDNVAVEWQFASTEKASGKRQVVSDAIIAHVKNGKFTVWKEYLDGRVKGMQADGTLQLDEGQEPFPWPLKTNP